MAKKVQPKTIGEAYKGTISTFIITMFIIFFGFFLPMITANELQNAREGKGRFTPEELLVWDFNSKSDLQEVQYTTTRDVEGRLHYRAYDEDIPTTPESVFWAYHSKTSSSNQISGVWNGVSEDIRIIGLDVENVVDEYGVYTFIPDAYKSLWTYPHEKASASQYREEEFRIYFDISSDLLIKNDVTRIDFFVDYDESNIQNPNTDEPKFRIEYGTSIGEESITGFKLLKMGEINSVEVTLEDLIEISSMKSSTLEYLAVTVKLDSSRYDEFTDFTQIMFDLQIYGLKGSPNAVAILSAWYMVQAVLIMLLGVFMLPSISFGGFFEKVSKLTRSV